MDFADAATETVDDGPPKKMVDVGGFEPPASALRTLRSPS